MNYVSWIITTFKPRKLYIDAIYNAPICFIYVVYSLNLVFFSLSFILQFFAQTNLYTMRKFYTLCIIIVVSILFSTNVFGKDDNQHLKDSLLHVISISKGEDKLNAYARLTTQVLYSYEEVDTLFFYFKEAIHEAQKQGNKKEEAQFKMNHITYLYNYERRKDLMETAPDYLNFLAENEQWEHYYSMYQMLLETFLNECRFETTIREANHLYEKAKRQNDPMGMSAAMFSIGVAYQKLERLEDAEDCFMKTIDIQKKMDKEMPLLFDVYFVLCEVLSEQKKHSEALKAADELGKLVDRREKLDNRIYPISRYSLNLIKAMIHLEMGDLDQADAFLDIAEKQIPDIERAMVNIYYHRSRIAELRKDYPRALELCDKAYSLCQEMGEYAFTSEVLLIKARVLSKVRESEDLFDLFQQYIAVRDSIEKQKFHGQVDELRTLFEVDKHIKEKQRNFNHFLFALAGCGLLAIALGIWIYYNRKIAGKNRTLAKQIRELTAQQELLDAELLNKMSLSEGDANDENLFSESRKDKLCIAIHNFILKEKAYRDPTLTRDFVIEELNTNKELFVEAFQSCFSASFPDYINSLRLKDAIALLERSDLSIEAVSDKTGFGSVRTFQRQFQKKYNMSPKDYRKSVNS